MAFFTSIDQIKPGMRVRCLYNAYGRYHKEATVVSVVEKGANTGTGHQITVKWDDGFIPADKWEAPSSFEPIEQSTTSSPTPSVAQVRQEKPCQVCGKPNDLGVKVCWMCGNSP